MRELLKREGNPSLDELNRWLAPRGLKVGMPFGFNNTYALAMTAKQGHVRSASRRISDLFTPAARGLTLGFSHEFLERADGWPAFEQAYGGPIGAPVGLDHGIAYDAIAAGSRRRDRRLLDRRQARPARPASFSTTTARSFRSTTPWS